jgi:hypothetical protein
VSAKEKAQAADFDVACVARLFLNGYATAQDLQIAVDKQEAAYDEWSQTMKERPTL